MSLVALVVWVDPATQPELYAVWLEVWLELQGHGPDSRAWTNPGLVQRAKSPFISGLLDLVQRALSPLISGLQDIAFGVSIE